MGIAMEFSLELLGDRIRFARERVGISQDELAVRLGRDQRTISQYENGKRKVLITDLPVLARILRVPVSFFFEGEDVLENLDKQLLTEFHRLDKDEDKTAVLELIRLFSDAIERYTRE